MNNSCQKNTPTDMTTNNMFVLYEKNMSVHNISMNAVLSSTLNLDNIYKYFTNCIYKPRDFKCIRIDVPVSRETVDKYTTYIKKKKERVENRKRKEIDTEKNVSYKLLNETSSNEVVKEDIGNEKNKIRKIEYENEYENENTNNENTNNENTNNENTNNENANNENANNENELKDLKKTINNYQCKTENDVGEQLTETKKTLDINTIEENKAVLELLNEIGSDDIDFIENEKIIINVSLFANGKVICTGNNSVEACKIAMKKIENKLKEYNVKNIKLRRITITNILAVYNTGFSIVLPLLAQYYKNVDYDPNVFPACKVKIALMNNKEKPVKATGDQDKENELAWVSSPKENDSNDGSHDIISASIFSTGNITLTGAKNYENLKRTINILLPYLFKCRSQHHHNAINDEK